MLEQLFGKGTKYGSEGENMIVVFPIRPRYTKQWLSGDKLKDEAAKAPCVKSVVDSSFKNQFGCSKTDWSNDLCWWVGKEISYSEHWSISMEIVNREERRD